MKGIVVAAALAVLAGIGAGALLWRRRGTRAAADTLGQRDWSCRCGQAYRVSGTDRHRGGGPRARRPLRGVRGAAARRARACGSLTGMRIAIAGAHGQIALRLAPLLRRR